MRERPSARGPAAWVIDGYATLFEELSSQARYDVILVPVRVGALVAACARHSAQIGVRVVGVEPARAACLAASLAAGRPTRVPTPGTSMAGQPRQAWPEYLTDKSRVLLNRHRGRNELTQLGSGTSRDGGAAPRETWKDDADGIRRRL